MEAAVRSFPLPVSEPAIVGNRVELQLFTTLACNLKCSYCSESAVVGSLGKVDYSMDALDAFMVRHFAGKEIYVTFYGGEPTLNIEFMQSVIDRHPHLRYQLQTNGTLLHRLPDAILSRLSNILISVDGGEATTDGFRGKGIYKRVIGNVAKIRDRVDGSLTARVTWSSEDITVAELEGLLDSFDYVYFQFVHAEGTYHPQAMEKKKAVIRELVRRFFEADGLYPFIPLMGIVRNKVLPSRMLEQTAGYSQCRVSTHIVNVLPDGRVFPCPDMTDVPETQQGDIRANWLKRSPLQPRPGMPCPDCSAFDWCRYNCMKNMWVGYVQNDEQYRRNVVEPVCELVRFVGEEIDRYDPRAWYARASLPVRKAIADCEIYEYCEIMP